MTKGIQPIIATGAPATVCAAFGLALGWILYRNEARAMRDQHHTTPRP